MEPNNDEIELLLWEYIDGTCAEADRKRIAMLISDDELWKEKYRELYALHMVMGGNMQPEGPSMRFTKNVMEAVAGTHIAPATRKYINKNIIRSIAAFFAVTLLAMLGYAVATADWNAPAPDIFPKLRPMRIETGSLFSGSMLNIFIAVNVALGLLLLDTWLRRKTKHSH